MVGQGTEQVPAMVAHGLLTHRSTTEPAADIRIVAVRENPRIGNGIRNQVVRPIDAVWFWGGLGLCVSSPVGRWGCEGKMRESLEGGGWTSLELGAGRFLNGRLCSGGRSNVQVLSG